MENNGMKEGKKENRKRNKKSSGGTSKTTRGWSKEKTVQVRMKKKGGQ